MLPVRILGTGSLLPGAVRSSRELLQAAFPGRDAAAMQERIGIDTRHWAAQGDSHASMAAEAVRLALQAAGLQPEALRRLIVTYTTGGDLLGPATANVVVDMLGLKGSCDCFDLNNACMGFLSGLDVAVRCVATGYGPVAVVSSEMLSRYLSPSNPRTYVIFGDAAAAAIVGQSPGDDGVLGAWMANDGSRRGSVTLQHPGLTGERAVIDFGRPNAEIEALALESLARAAHEALAQAGLGKDDIRWVLPHQPNGTLFRAVGARLGISMDRLVPVVQESGCVSSASIPLSLDRLARSGRIAPGDHLLLVGVGEGLSYGAMVYRVGAAGWGGVA